MPKSPYLSIIIPLYNKAKVVRSTLDSVLKQDFADYEVIIVDDGSTDNSVSVVREYTDERIKLFKKDNQGVSHTRNFGVGKATSDWLFFLDADDTLLPGALTLYVDLREQFPGEKFFTSNFGVTLGEYTEKGFCWGKKREKVKNGYKALWERKIFPRTGCLMVHRSIFEEIGGFQEDCVVWEDLDFVLNILERYEVVYTPEKSFVHHFEYNELSQVKKPIESEFAFYADIDKSKNFYHKLLLLELVRKVRNKRLKAGDNDAITHLQKKLKGRGMLLFLGQTERYIHKYLRRLTEN